MGECSGQGICARDTGSCECFPGYEGKACQRQTCPNSCSGHGRCQYIENLGYATTPFDFAGVRGIDGDDNNEAKYFTTAWGGVGTQQVGAVLGGSAPGYVAGDADTRRRLDEYVDYSRGPLQISYGNDVMDHRNNMARA